MGNKMTLGKKGISKIIALGEGGYYLFGGERERIIRPLGQKGGQSKALSGRGKRSSH